MGTRNRKGRFSAPPPSERPKRPIISHSDSVPTVSYRGGRVVDEHSVHLGEFRDVKLMWDHRAALFTEFFHNSPPSTAKNNTTYLRVIKGYWKYQQSKLTGTITLSSLNEHQTNGFVQYVQSRRSRHVLVPIFNRFLRAIGASARLLVPNPYSPSEPRVKKSKSIKTYRRALKRAKIDAEVIRNRLQCFHHLRARGADPRSEAAGWTLPENRIWFVENVIGLSVPRWNVLKSNPEVSRHLHDLGGFPGAMSTDNLGKEIAEKGYLAHVRWFYPQPDDIVPFVALLLLRTPLNLMSIADAQVGVDWDSPYYFNMSSKNGEFVFVWFDKVRGRVDRLDDPNPVFTISPKTPWSFPYQVRKFLEDLTSELRLEVKRQICTLSADEAASVEELNFLRSIENDLFLYRSYKGINSLRHVMRAGNPPLFLTEGLKNYGISAGETRGNNLAHVYNLSGQNLVSIHMLAVHRDKNLAILYARREAAVKKTEELFRHIFNNSIALISANIFDIENLKLILEAQEFSESQIRTLLSRDSIARWGNRCANPRKPPKGFDQGTPDGELCRGQNCIDGCPNARWFSDSRVHVKNLLSSLRLRLETVPHAVSSSSSLLSKISRLELIDRALERSE
ncbi:hypothetical protein [Ensifer aridi]|uniref:hypothetical protein n=1 Tax=Ensifer aridi TaxID=1708715 RepID=UPI001124E48D|nr:hypothetical protein [Ensifer aridi]